MHNDIVEKHVHVLNDLKYVYMYFDGLLLNFFAKKVSKSMKYLSLRHCLVLTVAGVVSQAETKHHQK